MDGIRIEDVEVMGIENICQDGRIIIRPKQMRNGCRHWTGTLFAPLQDGITRNTKGVIIC